MGKFVTLTSTAIPLPQDDVDTDIIYPARFLLITSRAGLARYAFHDWRFDESGTEKQGFALTSPTWRGSAILIAGRNFGCGSSREHAPWALRDLGIRCIIAPSFGEIFYNNCFKNGILPIVVSPQDHERAMAVAESAGEITIDLPGGVVRLPTGGDFAFAIDARRRDALVNGWDEIDLIATHHAADIDRFEAQQQQQQRWLWQPVPKKG
ncbi:MAG: 3-isopropylmalate dehydratase small subunit [Pseudomonadota bacterium]